MTLNGWFQILFFSAAVLLVTKPAGIFMARVFSRERTFLDPVLRPVERLIYRLTRVDEKHEMRWTEYSAAMLLFSGVSMLLLYLLQRLQHFLPLNPQKFAAVPADLAFNTAASFTTNTNWQFYTGEQTMSYLTQMAGSGLSQFRPRPRLGLRWRWRSFAGSRGKKRRLWEFLGGYHAGNAVGFPARMRHLCAPAGFAGSDPELQAVQHGETGGGAAGGESRAGWQASLGADGKPVMETISEQVIAQGPVASQEAIKMLGTNGGGFMNANSSHPFENPTPFTNFLEMFSIFIIPAGLTYTLGRMTGSQRHGWAVFAAMAFLFFAGVTTAYWAEARGNPLLAGVNQTAVNHTVRRQHGRQRSAFRDREFRAVRHGDHRCQLRRGQQHARFVYSAGRHGAAGEHHAGRGGIWRRGRGHVWRARVCGAGGVHRGIDGGPHAGIYGQKD